MKAKWLRYCVVIANRNTGVKLGDGWHTHDKKKAIEYCDSVNDDHKSWVLDLFQPIGMAAGQFKTIHSKNTSG